MRDQAISIAGREQNPQEAKNKLREYLQHLLLRKMYELNLNRDLVFHGGTALRIIHGLDRFSEDLDFHTKEPDPKYDVSPAVKKIKRELEMKGYSTNIKLNTDKIVQTVFFKFSNLLYSLQLSPLPEESLNVKVEINTNPPSGYITVKTMVNKYFPFSVIHHDKPSFIAGKCMAILQRPYSKGRDYFDLMYYLSRWKGIQPNMYYLNAGLKQTGYSGIPISEDNWQSLLLNKINQVDWKLVRDDVRPFLSSRHDITFLNADTFLTLLS